VSKAQSQPRYQQLKLAMDIPSAAEPQRQPKSRAEGHTEKLKLGKRKAERPEVRGQKSAECWKGGKTCLRQTGAGSMVLVRPVIPSQRRTKAGDFGFVRCESVGCRGGECLKNRRVLTSANRQSSTSTPPSPHRDPTVTLPCQHARRIGASRGVQESVGGAKGRMKDEISRRGWDCGAWAAKEEVRLRRGQWPWTGGGCFAGVRHCACAL
jgi:hypothetical protein